MISLRSFSLRFGPLRSAGPPASRFVRARFGTCNSNFGEKKFCTAREEAPSVGPKLAEFANCCTVKRHKKTVTYNEDDWFLGLPTDRITELVVENVPLWAQTLQQTYSPKEVPDAIISSQDCFNTQVKLLVLPESLTWPSFWDTYC